MKYNSHKNFITAIVFLILFLNIMLVPTYASQKLKIDQEKKYSNDCSLDNNLTEYWGNPNLKLTNGTGFFDTYQDENGTWWFVTPNGYAFYSIGCCVVNRIGYTINQVG